jgi:hypothetical protein
MAATAALQLCHPLGRVIVAIVTGAIESHLTPIAGRPSRAHQAASTNTGCRAGQWCIRQAIRHTKVVRRAPAFRSAFPPLDPRHWKWKGAMGKRSRRHHLYSRRPAYGLPPPPTVLRLHPAAINRCDDGAHLAFDLDGIMMALRIRQFQRGYGVKGNLERVFVGQRDRIVGNLRQIFPAWRGLRSGTG